MEIRCAGCYVCTCSECYLHTDGLPIKFNTISSGPTHAVATVPLLTLPPTVCLQWAGCKPWAALHLMSLKTACLLGCQLSPARTCPSQGAECPLRVTRLLNLPRCIRVFGRDGSWESTRRAQLLQRRKPLLCEWCTKRGLFQVPTFADGVA